jgi:alpha-tubulin suppressor-like RCC1 family protein
VSQIACGQGHSLAIAEPIENKRQIKPQLYSWGNQKYYQCGHGSGSQNDIEVPTRIEFFKKIGVARIAAGRFHSLALSAEESSNNLYAWGLGHYGRLGNHKQDVKGTPQLVIYEKPSPKINYDPNSFNVDALSNEKIVDFVCGDSHNLILTEGGHMWSFGWNIQG